MQIRLFQTIFAVLTICLSGFAFAFELQEEVVTEPYRKFAPKSETTRVTVDRSTFSRRSQAQPNFFENNFELRAQRRVGVGFQVAGHSGMAGALVELNLMPENSMLLGFGGGPKYNSFHLGWRYSFGGRQLAPYFSLSYLRWYNSNTANSGINNSSPSFLADRFLTEGERSTGIFAKDLIAPAIGFQYLTMGGPSVGTSIFAEVMMILNLASLQQSPTGSLGIIYYF